MFNLFTNNPAVALLKEDHDRVKGCSTSSRRPRAGRRR